MNSESLHVVLRHVEKFQLKLKIFNLSWNFQLVSKPHEHSQYLDYFFKYRRSQNEVWTEIHLILITW